MDLDFARDRPYSFFFQRHHVPPGDDAPQLPPPPPPNALGPVPAAEVEIEAADPANRDVIIDSIAELEERAWRKLEEEAALPPLPPPPTKRWSVAIPLLLLAILVWTLPFMFPEPFKLSTPVPPRTDVAHAERLLRGVGTLVDAAKHQGGLLPRSLSEIGPFATQIHYYPDTGGAYMLELPLGRGAARLISKRGVAQFHYYGPTDLRPAPPIPPRARPVRRKAR